MRIHLTNDLVKIKEAYLKIFGDVILKNSKLFETQGINTSNTNNINDVGKNIYVDIIKIVYIVYKFCLQATKKRIRETQLFKWCI